MGPGEVFGLLNPSLPVTRAQLLLSRWPVPLGALLALHLCHFAGILTGLAMLGGGALLLLLVAVPGITGVQVFDIGSRRSSSATPHKAPRPWVGLTGLARRHIMNLTFVNWRRGDRHAVAAGQPGRCRTPVRHQGGSVPF